MLLSTAACEAATSSPAAAAVSGNFYLKVTDLFHFCTICFTYVILHVSTTWNVHAQLSSVGQELKQLVN